MWFIRWSCSKSRNFPIPWTWVEIHFCSTPRRTDFCCNTFYLQVETWKLFLSNIWFEKSLTFYQMSSMIHKNCPKSGEKIAIFHPKSTRFWLCPKQGAKRSIHFIKGALYLIAEDLHFITKTLHFIKQTPSLFVCLFVCVWVSVGETKRVSVFVCGLNLCASVPKKKKKRKQNIRMFCVSVRYAQTKKTKKNVLQKIKKIKHTYLLRPVTWHHLPVRRCVCVCVCVCLHRYTYTCIYIHIHMHTCMCVHI